MCALTWQLYAPQTYKKKTTKNKEEKGCHACLLWQPCAPFIDWQLVCALIWQL